MRIIKELIDELKAVLRGKTLDAMLPPLVFAIANGILGLQSAVVLASLVGGMTLVLRLLKKDSAIYSFGGLVVVLIAAGLALVSGRAANYFLPAALGSAIFFIVSTFSVIINKPIAAISSHITRGWEFEWYYREDVRPAYKEVSIMWAVFFALRFGLQLFGLLNGDVANLATINFALSFPVTLIVLIISYLYGIWRLKNLAGPGITEFRNKKDPPWEGQKKGF